MKKQIRFPSFSSLVKLFNKNKNRFLIIVFSSAIFLGLLFQTTSSSLGLLEGFDPNNEADQKILSDFTDKIVIMGMNNLTAYLNQNSIKYNINYGVATTDPIVSKIKPIVIDALNQKSLQPDDNKDGSEFLKEFYKTLLNNFKDRYSKSGSPSDITDLLYKSDLFEVSLNQTMEPQLIQPQPSSQPSSQSSTTTPSTPQPQPSSQSSTPQLYTSPSTQSNTQSQPQSTSQTASTRKPRPNKMEEEMKKIKTQLKTIEQKEQDILQKL